MPSSTLLSSLYDFLSYRRRVVYAATLGIIGLCVLISSDVNVQEDIGAMLPDSPSELRVDFELMQQAPFARKVIVNLKRRPDADPMALTDAVESLRKEMSPPRFTHVVSSPGGLAEGPFFTLLFESLPNLSSEQDIAGRTHVARDEYGLTQFAVSCRKFRVTRWKGSRRALAMHTKPPVPACHLVSLDLGNVVGDIIDLP